MLRAVDLDAAVDDLAQLLLAHQEVHFKLQGVLGGGAVHIAQVLGDGPVENHAAHGGVHQAGDGGAVEVHGAADANLGVQGDVMGVVSIMASSIFRNTLPSPGSPSLSKVR